MKFFRNLLDLAIAGALLAALILAAAWLQPTPNSERFSVIPRVADGDTLVFDGTRVRILGIDAPELDQMCGEPALVPCGRIARAALVEMAANGLDCRASGRDRFQRPLVSCTARNGADIASRMVAAGQAVAYGCCEKEEATAKIARRGIWAAPFLTPREWRARRGDEG